MKWYQAGALFVGLVLLLVIWAGLVAFILNNTGSTW